MNFEDILKNRVLTKNGCLEWKGGKSKYSYGHVHFEKKRWRVHRLVWFKKYGVMPNIIDHLCRNRICANVDHLDNVDLHINNLRGFSPSALNARKTKCYQGHQLPDRPYKGKRYCKICKAEYDKKQAPRKRVIEKLCVGCNTRFMAAKNEVNRGKGKFCNKSCYTAFQRHEPTHI